ncbi:MAG: hypothetical protein B7Y23_10285 [Sulfurovum sp. 16-42-52]|nr:MAG: hypothetical protein B7Y23_10285 [Sulfurovum sp. 16-42-52]
MKKRALQFTILGTFGIMLLNGCTGTEAMPSNATQTGALTGAVAGSVIGYNTKGHNSGHNRQSKSRTRTNGRMGIKFKTRR